jgi:hypothetical protein
MGGISSGRHPHYGGPLKQVALKFPTNSAWFLLAKRVCRYKEISFNEFVRLLVKKEVQNFKYTKMWPCECTDLKGKVQYNFKRLHYCNQCGKYQTEFHEGLYNRSK